jgi:hypothetical protein
MARLSRKHKNAIIKVISKWRDAFAGIRPVNHDRIRELINIAYSKKTKQVRVNNRRGGFRRWKQIKLDQPTIHFLRSPVAFDIAQAVLRGRLAKRDAEVLCSSYGIDKSFVKELRRDVMTNSFGRHHWHRGTSALTDVWQATLEDVVNGAQSAAFEPEPEPESDMTAAAREKRRRYKQFAPSFPDLSGLSRDQKIRDIQNNNFDMTSSTHKMLGAAAVRVMKAFSCRNPDASCNQQLLEIPWSSGAASAMLSRCERAAVNGWGSNYMDAEIVYELMGIKDVNQTWAYELMREAHLVMCFQKQVLVLAERPTVHTNANGELHNDEGPAVAWVDGAKQYYIDGHELGHLGELIVDRPEQLTLENINNEENEEVKRLAIERYGWGRYLEEIGARVLDRRNNAVDNTIEALVSVRTKFFRRTWGWRAEPQEQNIEQRKLILSCRSTARQYFLAVPETVGNCEEGQHWMAEGANTRLVDALRHPVRVIGAS